MVTTVLTSGGETCALTAGKIACVTLYICFTFELYIPHKQICTTVQCIPVDAFVLLTVHAISEAATTTDPPTRTTTAATTAPVIAQDTCVEELPPTVAGVNMDDGHILPATAFVMTKLLVTSGTVHSKHTSLQLRCS